MEKILEELRKLFPHGHEKFVELCFKEMDLHSQKNHDYAAGGDHLGNFMRVAKILSLYPGLKISQPKVIALVYCMKQFDSVLHMFDQAYEGKVEGIKERLQDISVYTKLISILYEEEKR